MSRGSVYPREWINIDAIIVGGGCFFSFFFLAFGSLRQDLV